MSENSKTVTAAVLVIGNEILSGRTQDTNTQWIAEKLNTHGVRLMEARVIPDVKETIIKTLHELMPYYDYVFTTGGIGPTHDDITSESIAAAFDVPVILDERAHALLLAHYGADQLTDARLKMAKVPQGSELIPNPVSSAPGFKIGNVYCMAGVPRIMQAMFDFILTTLEGGDPVLSNTVVCNLYESQVAQALEELESRYSNVEIGSYPHYRGGTLGLSLVLRSTNAEQLAVATRELIAILQELGDEPNALSLQAPI